MFVFVRLHIKKKSFKSAELSNKCSGVKSTIFASKIIIDWRYKGAENGKYSSEKPEPNYST